MGKDAQPGEPKKVSEHHYKSLFSSEIYLKKRFVRCSEQNWIKDLMRQSGPAPNRAGKVFSFTEFKTLLTKNWDESTNLCLAKFLVQSFCAKTFLLGALRTKQFLRFRHGGLASVRVVRDQRDNR